MRSHDSSNQQSENPDACTGPTLKGYGIMTKMKKTKKELCEMIDNFARERNQWKQIATILYNDWKVIDSNTGQLKDGRLLFEEMTK
jgi:hypothetical protein